MSRLFLKVIKIYYSFPKSSMKYRKLNGGQMVFPRIIIIHDKRLKWFEKSAKNEEYLLTSPE